jgi:hypothetical protein
MGGACSHQSYTVVMEEGYQKSKGISYIWQSSNMKLFGVELMKATFNCGGNTINSLGPRKDDFLILLMMQSLRFSREMQD